MVPRSHNGDVLSYMKDSSSRSTALQFVFDKNDVNCGFPLPNVSGAEIFFCSKAASFKVLLWQLRPEIHDSLLFLFS